MKIQTINSTNYDPGCQKPQKHVTQQVIPQTLGKDSVSFSGATSALKSGSANIFKFIEKAGFFVEFLIVDTLSMILPRTLVGLNRDKDKTGKNNYKAAAEEFGREILSGPSMNLIPMGILAGICANKQTSRMSKGTLRTLNTNFSEVIENKAIHKDPKALEKALAEKLFEKAYGHTKVDDKIKQQFVNILSNASSIEKKLFNSEAFKNNLGEFESLIVNLNNTTQKEIAPATPKSVKIGETSHSASELYEDFANFSKDFIKKFTQADFSGDIKTEAKGANGFFGKFSKFFTKETAQTGITGSQVDKAKEFLTKLEKSRLSLKTWTAAAAFFAVGEFLLYLPKIYQRGKISPAEESARLAREAALKGGSNAN